MMMKIRKIGNSQGIILPKTYLEKYGYKIGDFIILE